MSSRVRLVVAWTRLPPSKPAKDSTLAIARCGAGGRVQLHYAEQKHLWLRDGVAWGRLAPLQVLDDLQHWFVLGEQAETPDWAIRRDSDAPRIRLSIWSTSTPRTFSIVPGPKAPWYATGRRACGI